MYEVDILLLYKKPMPGDIAICRYLINFPNKNAASSP